MLLSLESRSIDSIRRMLEDYLPKWIKMQELPESYSYTLFEGLPEFMHTKIVWSDIKYDKLSLNTKGIKFYIDRID